MLAGMILGISIPAMLLLSGNLNIAFGSMFNMPTAIQPSKLKIASPSSIKSTPALPNKAPAGFYKGTGYYTYKTDPASGKPVLTSAAPSDIQVAGSNGHLNTLGSVLIAKQLAQLANAETDPELKAYCEEMARLSFYLGAAEGELDDVPTFNFSYKGYNNGNALQDIYTYHQQILSLMQHPPVGANPEQLQKVLPLAVEVFNIGHNYVNNLSQFISADGKVTSRFTYDDDASLTMLVDYDQVRRMATEILEDYPMASQPVKTTLQDAQGIVQHVIHQQAHRAADMNTEK
jgi:hypothetical protein